VMICKMSNFDEILERITKFLIEKKMIKRFIFKYVNVGNVTYRVRVICTKGGRKKC